MELSKMMQGLLFRAGTREDGWKKAEEQLSKDWSTMVSALVLVITCCITSHPEIWQLQTISVHGF